jgi:hypothetical protein
MCIDHSKRDCNIIVQLTASWDETYRLAGTGSEGAPEEPELAGNV